MDWLTREEIREAAEESKKAAHKMSIMHHEQILAASPEDLKDVGTAIFKGNHCALCIRFHTLSFSLGLKEEKCPLNPARADTIPSSCGSGCCPEWRTASHCLDRFLSGDTDLETFKVAELVLLNKLKSTYEELYPRKVSEQWT